MGVKTREELIAEFDKGLDRKRNILDKIIDSRDKRFFCNHDILYYMRMQLRFDLFALYVRRKRSNYELEEWNKAWKKFCESKGDWLEPR